jgi:hypothetical protein
MGEFHGIISIFIDYGGEIIFSSLIDFTPAFTFPFFAFLFPFCHPRVEKSLSNIH